MSKIETIILRCVDPAAQQKFYVDVLGMIPFDDDSVGYDGPNAHLKFIKSEKPYIGSQQDLYWKIAIAIPNIEVAYEQLRAKGVDVGAPQHISRYWVSRAFYGPGRIYHRTHRTYV